MGVDGAINTMWWFMGVAACHYYQPGVVTLVVDFTGETCGIFCNHFHFFNFALHAIKKILLYGMKRRTMIFLFV